jgi:hypothetical protein
VLNAALARAVGLLCAFDRKLALERCSWGSWRVSPPELVEIVLVLRKLFWCFANCSGASQVVLVLAQSMLLIATPASVCLRASTLSTSYVERVESSGRQAHQRRPGHKSEKWKLRNLESDDRHVRVSEGDRCCKYNEAHGRQQERETARERRNEVKYGKDWQAPSVQESWIPLLYHVIYRYSLVLCDPKVKRNKSEQS